MDVWLSPSQQEELRRYIIQLKQIREQAGGQVQVDFGSVPRIVGGVCAYLVTLSEQEQTELTTAIDELEQVLADAAQGRMTTLAGPRVIVSRIC